MKKVLSVLLCLCMLLSMATMFTSCGEQTAEPKVSKKTVKVNLTDYEMVYASDLSNTVKSQASVLAKQLSTLAETPVREKGDDETAPVETADLEILVGNTMRAETVKAMKGLGDFGWAIRVFANKICIVGTNSFYTLLALNYFQRTYLSADSISGTTITLNEKVIKKNIETMQVVEEIEDPSGNYMSGLFNIVYDDMVDDKKNTKDYAGDAHPTDGGQETDYRYDLAVNVSKWFGNATTASANTFIKKDDTAEESQFEVLLGNMNRDIVQEELAKIEANQYGISIRDGKIVVLGWNDEALKGTEILLKEIAANCSMTDKKGNVTYHIPTNAYLLYTLENNWDVSFPKPEGDDMYLHGTVDVGDGSLEYVYTGSGADEEAYREYCKKLEEAGYTVHGSPVEEYNNLFRYYVHKGTGSALYVYYSPYSFAAEQQVANDYVPGIRIIASNTDNVTLPDLDILDPNMSYTKICESTITAVKFDYAVGSWGLSYVLRLEDGSFVIFDGGAGKGYDDFKYLRSVIMKLYCEVFAPGEDPELVQPTTAEPLHVRAWMMTHEHMDHFTVFKQFMQNYGPQSWFRFDYFLFNATSKTECYNCNNPEYEVRNYIEEMQEKVKNGFDYIKVHTGQKFYFANLKIEILYTHEDTYPLGLEYFNNSSSIYKTTFMHNGVEADTCIWLGDVERIGSRRMRAMWGNEGLKADMVQVAHHGYNGVEAVYYDVVSPTIVWYPSSKGTYNTSSVPNRDPNGSGWMYAVDYHLCYEVSSVKLIIMSDMWDTTMRFENGKAVIKENGDYDLYDISNPDAKVEHNNQTVIYTGKR